MLNATEIIRSVHKHSNFTTLHEGEGGGVSCSVLEIGQDCSTSASPLKIL